MGETTLTAQPQPISSEAAYLAFERASPIKHEYYNGHIYAMAGAKAAHNLIAGNTLATLHRQVRAKPCYVYPSDMRVKVLKTGLNTYPDVVVVCGQPQFTDAVEDTLINPLVIVEVLSPSTERYDRGMKFHHYRTIDSLRIYLLIAQDHCQIEQFSRQENGLWLFQEVSDLHASLAIPPLDCALTLAEVYEKVTLPPDPPALPRESPTEG